MWSIEGRLIHFVVAALLALPLAANASDYHHVHMRAHDTLEAATWYAANMDGELARMGDFDAVRFGAVLLLFAPADREGADGSVAPTELHASAGSAFDHLGFSFADLPGRLVQLEAAGAKVTKTLQDVGGSFTYAFIEDPWGQKVEVMQDPELVGIHHAHLSSADPAATIGWYQQMFGGATAKFKNLPGLPAIQYGEFWIIASTAETAPGPNMFTMLDHLGWSVNDLEADLEIVEQTGARILREAGPVFWWQEWIPFYRGPHTSFVESPDGVTIEILQLD